MGAGIYTEIRGAGPYNNPPGKNTLIIKGVWEQEEIEFELDKVNEKIMVTRILSLSIGTTTLANPSCRAR